MRRTGITSSSRTTAHISSATEQRQTDPAVHPVCQPSHAPHQPGRQITQRAGTEPQTGDLPFQLRRRPEASLCKTNGLSTAHPV